MGKALNGWRGLHEGLLFAALGGLRLGMRSDCLIVVVHPGTRLSWTSCVMDGLLVVGRGGWLYSGAEDCVLDGFIVLLEPGPQCCSYDTAKDPSARSTLEILHGSCAEVHKCCQSGIYLVHDCRPRIVESFLHPASVAQGRYFWGCGSVACESRPVYRGLVVIVSFQHDFLEFCSWYI